MKTNPKHVLAPPEKKSPAGGDGASLPQRPAGGWGAWGPTVKKRTRHRAVEFTRRQSLARYRLTRVEEDLVDQLFNSSEKRLARVLLLMANFGKEGKPEPVIAKISQETLAEIVGTTRSRVSSFMNKFRQLGFINYNGHLEVHNSLLNVILHDKPQIRRGDAEK